MSTVKHSLSIPFQDFLYSTIGGIDMQIDNILNYLFQFLFRIFFILRSLARSFASRQSALLLIEPFNSFLGFSLFYYVLPGQDCFVLFCYAFNSFLGFSLFYWRTDWFETLRRTFLSFNSFLGFSLFYSFTKQLGRTFQLSLSIPFQDFLYSTNVRANQDATCERLNHFQFLFRIFFILLFW